MFCYIRYFADSNTIENGDFDTDKLDNLVVRNNTVDWIDYCSFH